MNTKNLKHLQIINLNPDLKQTIEELIISEDFIIADNQHNYWSIRRDIGDAFLKQFKLLSRKHNIDILALFTYFSMDKKLFPKICGAIGHGHDKYFEFRQEDKNFLLDGSTILSAFNKNETEVIDFCFANADMFPESSKKYINNQKKKVANVVNVNKISNNFQKNALKYNFPDTFDFSSLLRNFKKFSDIIDTEERTKTLLNFYSILNSKYKSELDNEKFISLKTKILSKIYLTLKSCFTTNKNNESEIKLIKLILSELKDDKYAINFIFERLPEHAYRTSKTFYFFLYNLVDLPEHSKKLDEMLFDNIMSQFKETEFKFNKFSSDLQSNIMKEIKQNWESKNKKFIYEELIA